MKCHHQVWVLGLTPMCLQLHYSESAIAFSLQQCAQVWENYILSLLYCDHSWIFSAFLFSNDLQLLHRVLLESVMTSNMSRPDRLSMLQNWNKFNNSETRQLSMLHNWHKFNNSEYLNLTEDSDTSGKVGCNPFLTSGDGQTVVLRSRDGWKTVC